MLPTKDALSLWLMDHGWFPFHIWWNDFAKFEDKGCCQCMAPSESLTNLWYLCWFYCWINGSCDDRCFWCDHSHTHTHPYHAPLVSKAKVVEINNTKDDVMIWMLGFRFLLLLEKFMLTNMVLEQCPKKCSWRVIIEW